MARKTLLVDDIDGAHADETVLFSLDGTTYEINLTAERAKALREAVAPFVAAGRKASALPAGRKGRSQGKRSDANPELARIRAWATANGHQVAGRGRVPSRIMSLYTAAQASA